VSDDNNGFVGKGLYSVFFNILDMTDVKLLLIFLTNLLLVVFFPLYPVSVFF
jgi:hypothetical protein